MSPFGTRLVKSLLKQLRGRDEHPGLAPAHVGNLDRAQRQFLVVKISFIIAEIGQSPREDAAREIDVVGMKVFQLKQGDDTLGDTMHVDGIGPIVKVIRSAVLAEKLVSIKFESSAKGLVKLGRVQIVADVSQRAEIVTRVKVVHPGIFLGFAIEPGAINALTPD